MPEAVDVGSVLGGRYKVTAYVLASAEKDLVLDGVDQVLNRPVSILVASSGNASQVAASARDLATGDRNSAIQVLDLGITDTGTYLVTNRTPAADMLDLIVQQDPPREDQPFVEPFFTDTLGSEIFGGPRSTEPESYDDDHEDDHDYRHQRRPRISGLRNRFGRHGAEDSRQDGTSDLPPVQAEAAPDNRPSSHRVPPPPSRRPGGAATDEPHRRSEDADRRPSGAGGAASEEQERRSEDADRRASGAGGTAVGAGAAGLAAGTAAASSSPSSSARAASLFPLSGDRDVSDDSDGYDDTDRDEYDDEDSNGRRFTRVLVGVVLTVVLVVAVVLAATQLGSIFDGSPVADPATEQASAAPATEDATAPAPAETASAEPTPAPVTPVITGITRVVPDNPGLDAANDVTLPSIIDGNPATFWGNQVYASDSFGGLATNLALVVQLEEESTIAQVAIDQLNGAGGSFSVLVNDQPTLEGAEQIAQGGFTSPTVSLPIPAGADGPRTGRFVIVNFTQLPRLSNIQAQYPFGLRIAEIRVS
ncbi:ABC transporter substrate-binding protein [Arthrobacter bussei]|uniref:ABC transporter substrate-binding protein n=1 Tax=Arthrobacter bussei TaxID=2594179 RepID=UPI0017825B25|nr:ABC transporter substrate-binding protein [Arthrobacter bussei]